MGGEREPGKDSDDTEWSGLGAGKGFAMFTMIEIREIMWVYCSKLNLCDHPLTHISEARHWSTASA